MNWCSDCIKRDTCPIVNTHGFGYQAVDDALAEVSDIIYDLYKIRVTFKDVDFASCDAHCEDFEEVHYELSCGTLYLSEIKDKVLSAGYDWDDVEDKIDIDRICDQFTEATMMAGWHDALQTVVEEHLKEVV